MAEIVQDDTSASAVLKRATVAYLVWDTCLEAQNVKIC